MRLGLGTVQFGLNYGINNQTGKPNLTQIKDTVSAAAAAGIRVLDTAADYGDSETNLGKVLDAGSPFRIITKLSKNASPSISLKQSLQNLQIRNVYGVLFHDFQHYNSNPDLWQEMSRLKENGFASKVGFSLYLPEQLESIIKIKPAFDIVQVPYSVFDQRFEKYFEQLKNLGVEIHVRSIFVQGLVFRDIPSLDSFFDPIKPKIQLLHQLAARSGKSVESLCLNFVDANAFIDSIIIGVDSKSNVEQNVNVLNEGLTHEEKSALQNLKEDNEQMILPYNWPKK